MKTIFTKIIDGELPSVKIHEDDYCVVILDINPIKKGHCLVVSKQPYEVFSDCPLDIMYHLIKVAQDADKILRDRLHCNGTNLIINNGKAANQQIPHLHIHIMPRYFGDNQTVSVPHEAYESGEIEEFGKLLSF
ncbi:MAG: HIT family protein [Spirochaetaceae bacterium]|nr:HIT family protein [Spirochaetaceae bacterium]